METSDGDRMRLCYSVILLLIFLFVDVPALWAASFPTEQLPVTEQTTRSSAVTNDSSLQQQTGKFIRGQLTLPVSRSEVLRWDVGNRTDHLPFIVEVHSLRGQDRVSVTVVDRTEALSQEKGLPGLVLPSSYRVVAGSGIVAIRASITLSYSESEVVGASVKDEKSLTVFQRVGERWVGRPVVRHDTKNNLLTVGEITSLSDFMIAAIARPGIQLSQPVIDFGNVRARRIERDSIEVVNSGVEPLLITSIESSNERFLVSPAAASVPPGERLNIVVSFEPTENGPEQAMIRMVHNGETESDSIVVRGNGLAPVFVTPFINLDVGSVRVGAKQTDSVFVLNAGADTLFVSLSSSDAQFSVTPDTAAILPGVEFPFAVSFAPIEIGVQRGELVLTHNASGSPATIDLGGLGRAPIFSTEVKNIHLGTLTVGETVSRAVRVRNIGNDTLKISAARSSLRFVSIVPGEASVAPEDTITFTLLFPAGRSAGNRVARIIFEHDGLLRADTIEVQAVVMGEKQEGEIGLPDSYTLRNNYPNPFNPVTTIEYAIPEEANVTLKVFTMLGVEVKTLVSSTLPAGFYSATWDAKNDRGQEVSTGMYFYKLEAISLTEGEKPFVQVRKMLFVK